MLHFLACWKKAGNANFCAVYLQLYTIFSVNNTPWLFYLLFSTCFGRMDHLQAFHIVKH
jgi:hypothetical protein